jgi:2-phospho-L-lactate guanylyltransferase
VPGRCRTDGKIVEMSSPAVSTPAWTIIVPVKQTTVAKSRLSGISASARQRLAVAFAQDTVLAALRCSDVRRVTVVTHDPAGDLLSDLGADVIPDLPNAGLNPALVYAAQQVRRRDPTTAVAALSSDLPSLRPQDLAAAFAATSAPRWFVPDLAGAGTTMLAARARQRWTPHFGPGSRARHRGSGMAEVGATGLERLRRDVDTLADLADARRRGVGPHTSLVLASLDDIGLDGDLGDPGDLVVTEPEERRPA